MGRLNLRETGHMVKTLEGGLVSSEALAVQGGPLMSALGFLAEYDPHVYAILIDMADGGEAGVRHDTALAAEYAGRGGVQGGLEEITISPPCGGTVLLMTATFPRHIWELVYN